MVNPNSDNDTRWIDDRVASLAPPSHWNPDTGRAFERLMERRESASKGSRSTLSVAGIALIATGSVLFLLPWRTLMTPESTEPPKPALDQNQPNPSFPGTAELATVVKVTVNGNPRTTVPKATDTRPTLNRTQHNIAGFPEPPNPPAGAEAAKPESMTPAQTGTPPAENPGKGVTEPILISQVQPEYTPEAREAKIQGTVELLCVVHTDGTVKVDSIKKSLGYGLDEKAREAVEQWRFIPAKRDGVSVAAFVSILVNFTLRK